MIIGVIIIIILLTFIVCRNKKNKNVQRDYKSDDGYENIGPNSDSNHQNM